MLTSDNIQYKKCKKKKILILPVINTDSFKPAAKMTEKENVPEYFNYIF